MDDSREPQRVDENAVRTGTASESRINRRAVVLTITLFLLIVAAMFAFAYMNRNAEAPQDPAMTNEDEGEETPYAGIERINAKHFYIDGVHTIAGEVAMPTPCDLLEADAIVRESMPEQIEIQFSVINNAEVCAQVITPQRFMVSAEASENATFSATLEGRSVELNLIEAAPGETPEDFELFIKG